VFDFLGKLVRELEPLGRPAPATLRGPQEPREG
jgi:hypothetical protein